MYRTAITLVKRAKWIIGPVGAIVIVVGAMYTVAAVHGQANPVSAIVTTLGDGRTEFTLHNYASVPITAYAIRSSTQTKNGTLRSGWLKDSAMSPLVPPIAPGGEVSLIVAQAGQTPVCTARRCSFWGADHASVHP